MLLQRLLKGIAAESGLGRFQFKLDVELTRARAKAPLQGAHMGVIWCPHQGAARHYIRSFDHGSCNNVVCRVNDAIRLGSG